MKFRDPKTGEVFENITDYIWRRAGCKNSCPEQCAIGRKAEVARMPCAAYVRSHPLEAARLMGYEVIDEEDQMEQVDKPRICEVLGVEVGEPFDFGSGTYIILEAYGGEFLLYYFGQNSVPRSEVLAKMIAHRDRIIRKPRFTEEEVEMLRYMASVGVVSIEKKVTRISIGTRRIWAV